MKKTNCDKKVIIPNFARKRCLKKEKDLWILSFQQKFKKIWSQTNFPLLRKKKMTFGNGFCIETQRVDNE